jgi:hypothetical protein
MISQKWFCRTAWFRARMVERVHEIQDAEDAEQEERDVVGD